MARSVKSLRVVENSDLARRFNSLLDEIERRTLNVVSPLYLSETLSGTMLSWNRGILNTQGGSTTAPEPFDITLKKQADPSTHYDVTIIPGTVNQFVPSNMFDTADYDPTTNLFIKLSITTDGKTVTGATLVAESTTAPALVAISGAGQTAFQLMIGVITVGAKIYKTWQGGDFRLTLQQVFLEDKTNPSPGTSPYNRWYQWLVEVDT